MRAFAGVCSCRSHLFLLSPRRCATRGRTAIRCEWPRKESHQIVNHSMRARIPRPPLAVESSHCLTLNIMRPLSRSAAASSVLGVFRMLCISNFGVRNWPLVLVPGVNPFGRPELRCSGQCGDQNPLNPTRSTQCPAQNPKSPYISSFLASLAHLLLDLARRPTAANFCLTR